MMITHLVKYPQQGGSVWCDEKLIDSANVSYRFIYLVTCKKCLELCLTEMSARERQIQARLKALAGVFPD